MRRVLDALDANLYALTHRGNAGDVEHYVRLCQGAVSVLELGAGYGRVSCALVTAERTLWGLELDRSLLELGREAIAQLPLRLRRQVTLLQGDMRSFALPRAFERVVLPYNALFCLLSLRDVEKCFRAVRAALEPGGLFAFDVWNADRAHAEGLSPERDDAELVRFDHDGRTWSVSERCRRARAPQRLDVTYTYTPDGRGRARSQVVRQRYYSSAELFSLLADCGFAVATRLGSFSGSRFSERAARLIVTARAR
ncbi:MAG TPA: class I SAM-dependent methyltransferase [Polyangiaceae bacterium]|nr:class I SAM-dependent methyltransferase [Polyangiaceae bacterium]